MGLSRQEYWSGVPFPSQGISLTQGSNLGLLHGRQILYHLRHQGSPEYWSRLLFPTPGYLPDPEIEPMFFCVSCIGRWILYHYATWGRMDTCICMDEFLCCAPETITILLIGYTPIQKKIQKVKWVHFSMLKKNINFCHVNKKNQADNLTSLVLSVFICR